MIFFKKNNYSYIVYNNKLGLDNVISKNFISFIINERFSNIEIRKLFIISKKGNINVIIENGKIIIEISGTKTKLIKQLKILI